MMAEEMYWDTQGVVHLAALEGNRIGLKFADKNGVQRILTIPASHAVPLILSVTDFASKITKTHDVGEGISDVQRLVVDSIGVASARDGSEFSLVVKTVDRLEAHFLLPVGVTQGLAAGLTATLAEHGLKPENLEHSGPAH